MSPRTFEKKKLQMRKEENNPNVYQIAMAYSSVIKQTRNSRCHTYQHMYSFIVINADYGPHTQKKPLSP